MSIRKRYKKDGLFTWEFCITIQKHPRKQFRKSGFKTKIDAQQAEFEAIKKYKNKSFALNPEKTRFKDILDLFIEHIENSIEYSKGTVQNYKGYLKNHLQYFNEFRLDELTPLAIQQWLDASKNKSPYVLNGCRKLCKASFNYAIQMKLIIENPFSTMRISTEPKVIRKRFTIDEIKKIIKICKTQMPEFYCIFSLAIFTGMRLGEYSALKVEDIDFKNNRVFVTKQFTRGILKDRTKTRASTRLVNFSDTIGEIIKWHIKKQAICQGLLFRSSKENKPVSPKWIKRKFNLLLLLSGYPENYMRVHDLRGQFVDLLHTLGLPIVYISREVGHSRTATTNDIYSEIMSEVYTSANKKIEEKIFVNTL